MRGLVVLALLLGSGCRQLLGLEDLPTDASHHVIDANGDADAIVPLPDDMDADGIKDELDNCPTVPNADQANEDGDALGDACDPCPIDTNNTDTDGDGVGDACDPHPNAIGDKILIFEGFKNGVPPGWAVGFAPAVTADDAVIPIVANNHAAIVPPNGALANGTLSASVTIDTLGGANSCGPMEPATAACSTTSVGLPYDVAGDTGIFCDLDSDTSANPTKIVDLFDQYKVSTNPYITMNNYGWNTAVEQRLVIQRTGNTYNCGATPSGGAAHTANGSTGDGGGVADPHASVWIYNAAVHVHWMMYVKSP
jgi:hypothetical protein